MTHKRLMVNVETGEQYEEDLTPEEVIELEAGFAKAEEEKRIKAEAEAARSALLAKLGISEEEAKLLLS